MARDELVHATLRTAQVCHLRRDQRQCPSGYGAGHEGSRPKIAGRAGGGPLAPEVRAALTGSE